MDTLSRIVKRTNTDKSKIPRLVSPKLIKRSNPDVIPPTENTWRHQERENPSLGPGESTVDLYPTYNEFGRVTWPSQYADTKNEESQSSIALENEADIIYKPTAVEEDVQDAVIFTRRDSSVDDEIYERDTYDDIGLSRDTVSRSSLRSTADLKNVFSSLDDRDSWRFKQYINSKVDLRVEQTQMNRLNMIRRHI